ncbi:hypothetical protein QE152_g12480 [Popillia japonica]|uniref:Uncharacterized protein n=1 Tax=Popillia japonica TaxID=7064 RepID=A0AAW1LP20_POPJA
MSAHSPGANCEEDDCEGALHSLKRYIYEVPEEDNISSVDILDDEKPPYYTLSQISDTVVINSHAYIAGYMASRILKSIGSCKTCRTNLVSTKNKEHHILIECRAYSAKALVRPETGFISLFGKLDGLDFVLSLY